MFLFKILDEIILSITTAKENSVGEVWITQNLFAWSNIFLLLYLVNFGDDFFTEKLSTKNPIYKKNVLRWRKQMVSTESDSKVPANAINCKPQTGRVPPRAFLLKKCWLKYLINIAQNYKTTNDLCVKSEMPFIDEKRKTVKKREGKMREKRRDITVKKERKRGST